MAGAIRQPRVILLGDRCPAVDGWPAACTGLRSALTGKPPEQTEPADAHADQQEPGGDAKPGLGARLGAAFSLLLRKAQQLLQFLAQQALRGLQALQHLTGRGDDQDQADEHDQTEDQADGDQEELDHADEQDEARDRRADDGQGTRRRVAAR